MVCPEISGDHLKGGHIILLNPPASPYYEETRKQALLALRAFPGECRSEEVLRIRMLPGIWKQAQAM